MHVTKKVTTNLPLYLPLLPATFFLPAFFSTPTPKSPSATPDWPWGGNQPRRLKNGSTMQFPGFWDKGPWTNHAWNFEPDCCSWCNTFL
ncbi:hypothetical protein F5Y09DRAFT_323026 [Xylaria sp. FL1042]|nr:hypothetical protein F5Y09DRAFT_323026 [Xylaria sp. FL1042]